MLKSFWKWLFGGCKIKCCEYSEQLADIHRILLVIIEQGEEIMANQVVIKEKIAEVKEAALAQLVALDEKVEAILKLVNDEEGTAEVVAALEDLKSSLSAAIEKAGTDDPDTEV